jgi:hypothetical protein
MTEAPKHLGELLAENERLTAFVRKVADTTFTDQSRMDGIAQEAVALKREARELLQSIICPKDNI